MPNIKGAAEVPMDELRLSEQVEHSGRIKELGRWFSGKGTRDEKVANVTVMVMPKNLESLDKMRSYVNSKKPSLIVLEEEENPGFRQMLEGKRSIKDYLSGQTDFYILTGYTEKLYEFLKELPKSVRVEQLSPPGDTASTKVLKGFERISQEYSEVIMHGDFEKAIEIQLKITKKIAQMGRVHSENRADEIASRIIKGDWKGSILIQSSNSYFKNALRERLEKVKNVGMKTLYQKDDAAKESLGERAYFKAEPVGELERLYRFEKSVDANREKLLAARQLVLEMIYEQPVSMGLVKGRYAETKLVEQLSYDECKVLFKEFGKMGKRQSLNFLREYLERRGRGEDLSSLFTHDEEPKKEMLGEVVKGTRITMMYELHSLSCREYFMDYVKRNKPSVIAIEWEEEKRFQSMLDRKMSVEEYLRDEPSGFYQSTKELFEFLRNLDRNETKVEAIAPGWAYYSEWSQEEYMRGVNAFLAKDDFEGAVEAQVNFEKERAKWAKECEALRAEKIANKIISGEWKGEVVVMSGAFHRLTKYLLAEKLRRSEVKVSSHYTFKKVAADVFTSITDDVLTPSIEIGMMYTMGKEVSKEREKLLAGRGLIHTMIWNSTDTRSFISETRWFRATKMANQLEYDECKALSKELKDVGAEVRFDFVDMYLKKRRGEPLGRREAGGFTMGGHPLDKFVVELSKEHGKIAKSHTDVYEVGVNDMKIVNVKWKDKGGIFSKVYNRVNYFDEGFEMGVARNGVIRVKKIEGGVPYLELLPAGIQILRDSNFTVEREDMLYKGLVSLNDFKRILKMGREGKLKFDEQGLKPIEWLISHEKEIMTATSLFDETKKLRKHPEVEGIFEERVDRFIERMKKEKSAS